VIEESVFFGAVTAGAHGADFGRLLLPSIHSASAALRSQNPFHHQNTQTSAPSSSINIACGKDLERGKDKKNESKKPKKFGATL